MRQKKGVTDLARSEPAFLISCLDRHEDWAVVVCLVGGGQEINTGEAGIGAWIDAALADFPDWKLCLSSRLTGEEYGAGAVFSRVRDLPRVTTSHRSRSIFPCLPVQADLQRLEKRIKGAVASPAVEAMIDTLPLAVSLGKVAAGRSGPQNPQHAIERGSMVEPSTAATSLGGRDP